MAVLFLCNVISTALFILAVHAWTRENYIFGFWQKIARKKDGELRSILFEPVSECLVCMSSFWAIVCFKILNEVEVELDVFFLIPLSVVLALAIMEAIRPSKFLVYMSEGAYLLFIVFFVFRYYGGEIFAFMFYAGAVSGLLVIISRLLSTLNYISNAAEDYSENVFDMSEGVERIVEVIKSESNVEN